MLSIMGKEIASNYCPIHSVIRIVQIELSLSVESITDIVFLPTRMALMWLDIPKL